MSKKEKQRGDEAVYKAGKGFGGDHDHLAKNDWTADVTAPRPKDRVLKAQIAEDEKLDTL